MSRKKRENRRGRESRPSKRSADELFNRAMKSASKEFKGSLRKWLALLNEQIHDVDRRTEIALAAMDMRLGNIEYSHQNSAATQSRNRGLDPKLLERLQRAASANRVSTDPPRLAAKPTGQTTVVRMQRQFDKSDIDRLIAAEKNPIPRLKRLLSAADRKAITLDKEAKKKILKELGN